ncbi:UNVERIFIED_CONTAM: Major strawberry allergen Fra a 1.08 [Sesamum latifolium]|uniref:Major strawberry allergen Fra a 1.08 n=1 Tax=Sesamum latifolium TaxID=2727402 RepID=A0AAW2YAH3_9LAMI
MAITTFTDEYTLPNPPSRIYKPSIIDSHNLVLKLMPQAIKSIEIIQGDGSAGSIKQINFAEGSPFKCVKYRVDKLNEKTFTYGYTLIEGDSLVANLEKITYEVKFEQPADGGSNSKVTSKYYTTGDFTLKEDEVKTVRAQASTQALSSETPHTVTHVSEISSLENAPTFFSILFEVEGGRESTLKDDVVGGSPSGTLVTGTLARNGGRLLAEFKPEVEHNFMKSENNRKKEEGIITLHLLCNYK